ncbi:hypothetical protein BD309DRAFT_1080934 [Dichomitus squalens]|nr:hypothetical protein BD309DRAFT_1080934 [Dichomitus squalens]
MAPIRGQTGSELDEPEYVEEFVLNEVGDFVVRFKCRTCGTSTGRKADFERHMNDKHRPPQYFCDFPGCDRALDGFTQKGNLKTHKTSVHLKLALHHCPHLWVDPHNGRIFPCRRKYRDGSALTRHRSLKHGFEPGDDVSKVAEPTPVGTRFPDSKYAPRKRLQGSKSVKRAFTSLSVAGRSSAPYTVPPPSTRRSSRKNVSRTAVMKQEQEHNLAALHPVTVGQPCHPPPVTVVGWDMGSSSEQLQDGACVDDSLKDPEVKALYDALCAEISRASLAPQIPTQVLLAADHYWTLDPHFPALDCHVAGTAFDGVVTPTARTIPKPSGMTTSEQTNMLNAGLGPFPNYYDSTANASLWDESVVPASSAPQELTSSSDNAYSTGWSQWIPNSILDMPENHACLQL